MSNSLNNYLIQKRKRGTEDSDEESNVCDGSDVEMDQPLAAKTTKKVSKLKEYRAQLLVLQKRDRDQTRELTQLKIALANSNHTLMAHGIQIPENAKMATSADSEVSACEFSTNDRALLLPSKSVSEREVERGEAPFRFDQCGIPDTSNIVKNTRFGKNVLFPHCVASYNPTGEPFVPQVEARKRFVLRWRVVNRRRPEESCDEYNLKPGEKSPCIEFKMLLVYADEPETEVKLQDLDKKHASHLTCLSEPNIIGQSVAIQGGVVTFCISKLHVTSKMVGNRKFLFRLVCIDPDLKDIQEMHASSIPFYSVSRFRPTDFEASTPAAKSPSPVPSSC